MKNIIEYLRRIKFTEAAAYLGYTVLLGLFFISDLADRPIWLDETYTYYQVSARNFPEFLESFGAGINAMPYSYFLVLWGMDQLFALGPATLRLPSLIFAITAIGILHRILKTRYGNGIAFVGCASALLISGDFILYAHEARPYSLYVLITVFSMHAGIGLLRDKVVSNYALLINGMAAFSLPSVHYVGIIYSFCLAVTLLLAGGVQGRRNLIKVTGSFCMGWMLFLLLHISQMLLFASRGGIGLVSWIPKPTLEDVLNICAHFFALPLVVSMILIAFAGFRFFKLVPERKLSSLYQEQSRVDAFLFLLAIGWLLIPLGFYFMGAIGLPNMSLLRYFLPSYVAVAVLIALLLMAYIPQYDSGKVGSVHLSNNHAIDFGVLLLVLVLIYRAGHAATEIHSTQGWEARGQNGFPYVTDSDIPCVTNNVHQFFPYNYYRGDRQILHFLQRTPGEVGRFKRLDNRLPILSINELTRFPSFRFVIQKGSGNLSWEFDIHAWGKANGYAVNYIGARDNVYLYVARRIAF